MSLNAFHLGQIISTVLGQVDNDGQYGIAARTPIWDETSETDNTKKRRFRHSLRTGSQAELRACIDD